MEELLRGEMAQHVSVVGQASPLSTVGSADRFIPVAHIGNLQ